MYVFGMWSYVQKLEIYQQHVSRYDPKEHFPQNNNENNLDDVPNNLENVPNAPSK